MNPCRRKACLLMRYLPHHTSLLGVKLVVCIINCLNLNNLDGLCLAGDQNINFDAKPLGMDFFKTTPLCFLAEMDRCLGKAVSKEESSARNLSRFRMSPVESGVRARKEKPCAMQGRYLPQSKPCPRYQSREAQFLGREGRHPPPVGHDPHAGRSGLRNLADARLSGHAMGLEHGQLLVYVYIYARTYSHGI